MLEDPIEQLDQWLKNLTAEISAVEFHGMLTGLITTRGGEAKQLYIEEVGTHYDPNDLLQQEAIEGISLPFESLRDQLNDPLISFYPLLLEDEEPFAERVDAMAVWCQGYLLGLSRGGLPETSKLSADTGEFLEDILAFSRAENFELDEDEGDEKALHEIIEYLRAGVVVVHDELQPVIAPSANQNPTQLH